ncbi:M23 family metallopeptidase [Micromonospora sp. CA-248260]|uniref:M23 family metallopeptidase n=1 Tax=Micromonospora sp. CA-248260 TaxID=3239962 RepID=UPI003D93C196
MTLRSLVSLTVALTIVFILCAGGLGGFLLGGNAAAGCVPVAASSAASSPLTSPSVPPGGWPAIGGWDSDQVGNAAAIVTTGVRLAVPARGWVIAVATAMQESTLRNLPGGDRDSVGLFQQRPSQGWGTPAQLRDPVSATERFFGKLVTISGWQAMPLTDAAQAVQISAYPDAYATWETPATDLVTAITDTTGQPTASLAACDAAVGPWTQPVLAPLGSGFRTSGRPGHDGVDLSAPRGTLIRAASAGTVRTVRCNAVHANTGAEWGCDRDGDPILTAGCGWYVDIDHAAGLLTRYCHMDQPPMVTVGQQVAVGQPIGVVGSTGHSSGPHLHYEVHHHGDPGPQGAVDPVPFMAARNAPLPPAR